MFRNCSSNLLRRATHSLTVSKSSRLMASSCRLLSSAISRVKASSCSRTSAILPSMSSLEGSAVSDATRTQRHRPWNGGILIPSAIRASLLFPVGGSLCHGIAALNSSGSSIPSVRSITFCVSVTLKVCPLSSPHIGHIRSSPIARISYSVILASTIPEMQPNERERTSAALDTTSQYL